MPDIFELVQSIANNAQDALTSKTIYGEPITAGSVTVVPVAEVRFGFGGGGGGGTGEQPGENGEVRTGSGGGGGGGGGGAVEPVGFIEITEHGSRWVPVEPPQSTQLLKALNSAARILPFGGRRGILAVIALIVAQVLLGQMAHSRAPALPAEPFISR
jgi:uncharacterized spore protein YtfJ